MIPFFPQIETCDFRMLAYALSNRILSKKGIQMNVDGGRNPRKSGGTFFSGIKNAMRER
jgi:hypothetical protein